jgi:hypothetical protein
MLGDTKERLEQITDEMRRHEVEPETYEKKGQLTIIDSEGALQGLARFGQLNEAGLREILDLTRKEVEAGKYSRVRFCMRFAPQVAESGESDLAASIEDFWQTSSRKHPSVALCAYSMKNLHPSIDNIAYWRQLMKSHTFLLSDIGLVLPLKPQESSIPYMEYRKHGMHTPEELKQIQNAVMHDDG